VRRCQTCALPKEVRDELHRGREQGIGPDLMFRWLESEGYHLTQYSVQAHFQRRHPEFP
jgi:hypothetical protein